MTNFKSGNSSPPTTPSLGQPKLLPWVLWVGKVALRLTQRTLRYFLRLGLRRQILLMGLLGAFILLRPSLIPSHYYGSDSTYPPLAMPDGNPYVRALMRTISASESNDINPYGLLYGGKHFSDWSAHPNQCIEITTGPNRHNCTTAAGRYQFITTTWDEKARLYHPKAEGWLFWRSYPFDPVSQDRVVYRWLTDVQAWQLDIPARLKAGQLAVVLRSLSDTWTSLGYGIETNEMTPYLHQRYHQFLKQEQA